MKNFCLTLGAFCLVFLLSLNAFAQTVEDQAGEDQENASQGIGQKYPDDKDSIKGHVGVGVGLAPDYNGSNAYIPVPYFNLRVNHGNYYARLEGAHLRFNVIDNSAIHFGPVIGLRRSRESVASIAVSRMRDISSDITAGFFVEYEHVGDDPRAAERITLSAVKGMVNDDGGVTVTLRGVMRRPVEFLNPGFIATIGVDTVWGNRNYTQTYFGVDTPNAALSGLPAYRAGAGFESVGTILAFDQFLSREWSVGLRFHYARLVGDAADSPITSIAGSSNQFFAGFVVGYVL